MNTELQILSRERALTTRVGLAADTSTKDMSEAAPGDLQMKACEASLVAK